MEFMYVDGNGLLTESLGTLLKGQSSQNNEGTLLLQKVAENQGSSQANAEPEGGACGTSCELFNILA